jgi:redox-sensitive bicupin YhaK (pirin superfamily)
LKGYLYTLSNNVSKWKGNMIRRSIKKIVGGQVQYDGAGVKLVRVFGRPDAEDFDPFLLLDAFDSEDDQDYIKGFPWHPHRGIETVTYLIKGDIEHQDSLGNKGSILDGSCQWMTAGSGIIHQEMPQSSEHMLGAQLWVNLPQKDKMTEPAYRDIENEMVPEVEEDNATVRILSGHYKGTKGAIEGTYVKTLYLDVALKGKESWEIDVDPQHTIFIYLVSGSVRLDDSSTIVPSHRAVLFTKGDKVKIEPQEEGVRLLFVGGKPLNEKISWGGPIVMNTREELALAFRELEEGTFIK